MVKIKCFLNLSKVNNFVVSYTAVKKTAKIRSENMEQEALIIESTNSKSLVKVEQWITAGFVC
jgi:hypothetical protein